MNNPIGWLLNLLGIFLFLTPILVIGRRIRRHGLSCFGRTALSAATVTFYVLYFFPLGATWAFELLAHLTGEHEDLKWEWVTIIFAPAIHAIAVVGTVLLLAFLVEVLWKNARLAQTPK